VTLYIASFETRMEASKRMCPIMKTAKISPVRL
jgi:hypothetical protein